MNKGMSLQQLAAEIEKVEAGKMDYVVPTMKMEMQNGNSILLDRGDDSREAFTVGEVAHEQIGSRLGIPRDYYKRMRAEAPELLDRNVNNWLKQTPERRLVRTYNGHVRAFLSDRYKPRENYALASVALPIFHQTKNLEVMSANLSERNMHIKVISHELEGEVKIGQFVKAGVCIRNSEVGLGASEISLFVYVLACMNGMIRENSMRSFHVGKRIAAGSETEIGHYSPETIEADNHAWLLQVRDNLRYAFDRTKFDEELVKFRAAAYNMLNPSKINETIEDVTKRFNLTQTDGEGILARLMVGGDYSQWGLSNAVTNLANDVVDYEKATDLEKIGGKIIDLNRDEWRQVSRLAA